MCIVIVPPVWGVVSLSLLKLVSYKHACCSIWGALWGPQTGSEYLVVMWKSRGMIKEFTGAFPFFWKKWLTLRSTPNLCSQIYCGAPRLGEGRNEICIFAYWSEMWFQLLVPWMSPSRGTKKFSVTETFIFSVIWTNGEGN